MGTIILMHDPLFLSILKPFGHFGGGTMILMHFPVFLSILKPFPHRLGTLCALLENSLEHIGPVHLDFFFGAALVFAAFSFAAFSSAAACSISAPPCSLFLAHAAFSSGVASGASCKHLAASSSGAPCKIFLA